MASGLDILEFADASEFFAIGDADEYVLDADLPDSNNDVEESDPREERRAEAAHRLAGALGILSGSLNGLDDAIFGVPAEDALLGLDWWSFKSVKSAVQPVSKAAVIQRAWAKAHKPPVVKSAATIAALVAKAVSVARGKVHAAQIAGKEPPVLAVEKAAAKALVAATGVPAIPVTAETIAAAKKKVDDLVEKRRAATCAAGTQREVLTRKAEKLGTAVETLTNRMATAADQGRGQRVKELAVKIDKLDTLRKIAGGRAIRFAKTQAVGAVMAANASGEANMLALAQKVVKVNPSAAKVLVAGARQLVSADKELIALRAKQIEKWQGATVKGKAAVAKVLAQETRQKIAAMQCCEPAKKQELSKRAAELELQAQAGELGDIWSKVKKIGKVVAATAVAGPAGAAAGVIGIKKTAKAVGKFAKETGKVLAQAGKVALNAAKKLKGPLCAVATNPAIMAAAAAAAGAPPTAGAQASSVAGALCPKPTKAPEAVPEEITAPAPTATSALPVAAAGIGAAALLFLL